MLFWKCGQLAGLIMCSLAHLDLLLMVAASETAAFMGLVKRSDAVLALWKLDYPIWSHKVLKGET